MANSIFDWLVLGAWAAFFVLVWNFVSRFIVPPARSPVQQDSDDDVDSPTGNQRSQPKTSRGHAILIKSGNFKTRQELLDKMSVIKLNEYGDTVREKRQIQRDYGWGEVKPCGKFYPPKGHNWYYYIYGDPSNRAAQRNLVAQRCAAACSPEVRQNLRGDIIIVRNGPVHIKYDPYFTLDELADAVLYYSGPNGRDPSAVFGERESTRAWGGPGGFGFVGGDAGGSGSGGGGGPMHLTFHGATLDDAFKQMARQMAAAQQGGGRKGRKGSKKAK